MKEEIEKATRVLVGTALWGHRRTADLSSFHFGGRRRVKTFHGDLADVGEFAINVQCPWRIVEYDRVLVGNGDLYYPPEARTDEPGAAFDWQHQTSRLDYLMTIFFQSGRREVNLLQVEVGAGGGLQIALDGACLLELFPNDSFSKEHWRLLKPGTEEPHFVVSGEGIKNS